MSGVDAAATLTLKIDTSSAAAELAALKKEYDGLRTALGTPTNDKGLTGVGNEAATAARKIETLTATVATLQAKAAAASEGTSNNMKIMLRSAEMTGNASIKAGEAQLKNLNSLKAAQASVYTELLRGDEQRAKSQAKLQELNASGTNAAARAAELAAAKQVTQQMEAQAALRELNVTGTQAAARAAELAAAKQLTQQMEAQAALRELNVTGTQAAARAAELAAAKQVTQQMEAQAALRELNVTGTQAAARSAELAAAKQVTQQMEAQAALRELNVTGTQAAARAAELAAAKQITQQMEAQAALRELNVTGTQAAARAAELAAAKQITQQMEAQAALRELNVTGTQAAARAAALAVEKQITKQLEEQAKWLALTDKQRAAATVQAAKAVYGGAQQSSLPGVAGSPQALSAAQSVGSVSAAQAELTRLTKDATAAQDHWNKVAGEGHALARGLAGSLGTLWITYGSLVPLLTGAALGAAFKQTATAGSEFAYQLTFVKALGTETTETMARLSDSAKSLGQNSLQGPVELASGFRILAQAGLNGADSILAMSSVLDLAVVGEMDMAQAGTTLVGVMNAFGLSVTSASHVGDVFAKAAALSQTSVQAMTESMKTASVVSEQYGASLEDTATALTLLAKVNITGTAAGTSLRNMLKELYTPSKQASDTFKQLGISVADAQGKLKTFPEIIFDLKDKLEGFDKISQVNILQRMFGERGAKEAISMLAETRDSWEKLNQSISNSSGFIRGVSAELEATTKGTFQQAMNALTTTFVSVFDKTEGPMKDMAIRLKTMFSSEEFKANVAATVTLLGNVAAATLSAVGAISTLINLLPDGSSGFALWVAGLSLLIPRIIGLGAASTATATAVASIGGASAAAATAGLASTGAAAATAASVGFGPLLVAVAAVTAGYVLFSSKTPAVISSVGALNSALDSQISRLRLVNGELQKKNTLSVGGGDLDISRAKRDLALAEGKLREYNVKIDKSRTADSGSILSGNSANKSREDYVSAAEAKKYRPELEKQVKQAKLNMAIAEGLEDQNRIEGNRASVNQQLKQMEDEKKLKAGTGKFVPTEKTKGGSAKVHDYKGDLEKSDIASLVQQEQENIKVLDLVHKNGLMSEEQYQAQLAGIYDVWGPKIEAEYSSSLSRLKSLRDAATGDEKLQYTKKYEDLATAHRKFIFDEEYRSAESIMKEQGQIKKASDDFTKIVLEQEAATKQVLDRLTANRLKLDMTPEQAAGYDARKASEKTLDKPVADAEARVQNLRTAGYAEESTAMVAAMKLMEDMIETRKRLGDEAAAQAEAEVGYARSYEFGWKQAFRTWTDEGMNAAKTAADSFQVMTNSMENFLDNFLTTGKLGFEDFAKSVILSIAKIEAKALLASATKGLGGDGGGGFGGILKGILGMLGMGGSSGGITGGTIPGVMSAGIAVGSAKGNVFSGSPTLHAYANTVQTTPQSFAFQNLHGFAKGGVFAEAGPEAVMPLARDSTGRLGVRAANDGNTIHVTVNISGNPTAPDVRRSGGQVARETAAAIRSTLQFA